MNTSGKNSNTESITDDLGHKEVLNVQTAEATSTYTGFGNSMVPSRAGADGLT